jgi:hypothetical protein
LEPTLEQGRQFDVYGPEVSVASNAPAFTRALGHSGRDPDWAVAIDLSLAVVLCEKTTARIG